MTVPGSLRAVRALARGAAYALAVVVLVIGVAALAIQSAWGKDRLRRLIVSQAERVLTGTLAIDRLSGSLWSGVRLEGVRLVQDGVPVVTIDAATISYRIRELYQGGTSIQRLDLVGLRVVGAKGPDGRWNLGTLVRSRPPRPPGQAPARTIAFESITLRDARVELRDPLTFGAARVPSIFESVNGAFAFELRSPAWRLDFSRLSWRGTAPDLVVTALSGVVATGAEGWRFDQLRVETPRSRFTVDGAIARGGGPTRLDLQVDAERFSFQEWGGVLSGLRNIAVSGSFMTRLQGPPDRLATTLDLQSTGGAIRGAFELNSSVPGWHGMGQVDVARLDLARWLNRPDRPSDITGHVDFDLDLDLGRRFPRGAYRFNGAHAEYLGYAADHLRARGELTRDEARIDEATATAYGADVHVEAGAIGIDAPYRYRFRGRADGVDLRRVPREVPVPHVESSLVLDYDVHGRFTNGNLVGTATFGESTFLGARIGEGATGEIDTAVTPFTYGGSGEISGVSLHRFGEGLDVAWMREPRYAGLLDGHFHVQGTGSELATMTLAGGGRLARAELFGGVMHDAEVGIEIARGSLTGRYEGSFDGVDVSRAFDDPRFRTELNGTGRATVTVEGLLTREVSLADYTIDGHAELRSSSVRDIQVEEGRVVARLEDQTATVTQLSLTGAALAGTGSGVIELDGVRSSRFDYDIARADLASLPVSGEPLASGLLTAAGRLTGPIDEPRLTGNGRLARVSAGGVEILSGRFDYDAVLPTRDPYLAVIRTSGNLGPLTVGSEAVSELSFAATYDRRAATLDLRGTRAGGINGTLVAAGRLDLRERSAVLTALDVTVQGVPWQLATGTTARANWTGAGVIAIESLSLADRDTGRQRISVAGDWGSTGRSSLHVTASSVYIDTFSGAMGRPARYGGRLDADAYIRGTAGGATVVTGLFTIVDGRIRRLPFERFMANVTYDEGQLHVDARLDQAPGVWLTASGTVPLSLFVEGQSDLPMRIAVASSPIDLGILEGVTDVVRDVSGRLTIDLTAAGSGRDPHFEGTIDLANAAFAVRATGARYRNGRLAASLSRDRVDVGALHLEDGSGHTLDVSGSLGTHELRVGDLAIDARASQFEVLRNEFGTVSVDAALHLQGQFESPKVIGSVAITSGELNVDDILDRVLMRPYATEATGEPAVPEELDALEALNPWERLGLDISVASRGTLRMVGTNVQVSSGTPLGLGNINVRAYGEVYLYKDPAAPLFVTGSFDSLVGTYAFQGRRFELDPGSSIVFRGDLNPELYVTVTREISGVQARVSIIGPLSEPELRLASTPPLDDSNILSLIVFNTNINDLSAVQQEELAVRAGTLAAGFLATPLVTALERSLGLDILEIESGAVAGGTPRVTIGDEIAPGLVARFTRQFGQQEYNEASIEYYLSRLFRIRATFSDAGATLSRSTFRRVERAGIDLLVFFSF